MATKKLPEQAYLRQCFDYDRSTGVVIWKERPSEHFPHMTECRRWNGRFAGREAGSPVNGRHLQTAINGVNFLLHRVVWKLETGEDVDEIDHRDRNGLDNRWENLRPATRYTNMQNRGKIRVGLKGAYRHRCGWTSRISSGGKQQYLGLFHTEEDAHAAYCKAARELHGEFANFG